MEPLTENAKNAPNLQASKTILDSLNVVMLVNQAHYTN